MAMPLISGLMNKGKGGGETQMAQAQGQPPQGMPQGGPQGMPQGQPVGPGGGDGGDRVQVMVASGGAAQSLIQEMMRSMNPASMMG